jgi:hypothetical protein
MASLEEYLNNELTLDAVSCAMIAEQKMRNRNYLGMSEIGEDCWRMLWYRFRHTAIEPLTLNSILAIDDGYRQEDIMADRLRKIPFVKLDTLAEDGHQFGYRFLGGHFAGHMDGKIIGILEAPKTMHVWENKAVNEKKFKELKNLIMEHGEKQALEKWDSVYYAQAQIYMHAADLTRHYLTVQSPGGRAYTSCRTEVNQKIGISLIAKAENIIKADRPPQRMSDNRSFYKCNWCRMKEVCFDMKVPQVCCRTCAFSEPNTNDKTMSAAWKCHKKNYDFTGTGTTCEHHLFLNTMVPFKTVAADDSSETPAWIKYQASDTDFFYNVAAGAKKIPGSICLTSQEIFEKEYFELCFSAPKNKKMEEVVKEKKEVKKLKGMI